MKTQAFDRVDVDELARILGVPRVALLFEPVLAALDQRGVLHEIGLDGAPYWDRRDVAERTAGDRCGWLRHVVRHAAVPTGLPS